MLGTRAHSLTEISNVAGVEIKGKLLESVFNELHENAV